MRITIATSLPALQFMRRAGYGFQKEAGGEIAFIRRVSGGMFPRYHGYVSETENKEYGTRNLQINLHVDQKAPTYGTERVHSGEYEGPLVDQEAARLRELVQIIAQQGAASPKPSEEKKGFWGKLFG